MEVLDVGRQALLSMRLGDFISYWCGARRERVLSVSGLEFSETRSGGAVGWGGGYGGVYGGYMG